MFDLHQFNNSDDSDVLLFQEENDASSVQGKKQIEYIDEETLISLVAERPALFDFRLPLMQRTKEITRTLWQEIIDELEGKFLCTILSNCFHKFSSCSTYKY